MKSGWASLPSAGSSRPSEFAAVPAFGTVVIGLLLWSADGWSVRSATEDFYPWTLKVALLCGTLSIQLWARSRPAPAFAAIVALTAWDFSFGPSVIVWLALCDVIYLATALGSRRLETVVAWTALIITALLTIGTAVQYGVKAAVYAALICVAITWSPIGYARSVRAYRRLAEVERQESAARRAVALADERRRVARELHDTVAGHLAAVAILADAAQRGPQDRAVLQSIRAGTLAALDEMRSTINLLTSPDDSPVRTTLASLEPLIATAEAAGGAVTLRIPVGDLPTAVETTLTRILSEVIANATKHSPGAPLDIDIASGRDEITVLAVNPRRPHALVGTGDGLRNIGYRAQSLGGTAVAGPQGDDWVVRASLPMRVASS